MSTTLKLISFDDLGTNEETKAPSPEYLKGFEDGAAAAQKIADQNNHDLSEKLISAVSDLNFSYSEAHSLFSNVLHPLFEAIANQIVPETLQASFGKHIVETLTQHAQTALGSKVALMMHPVDHDKWSTFFAKQRDFKIETKANPDLTEGSVVIDAAQSTSRYDASEVIAQIQTSLQAILETQLNEAEYD